MSRKICFVSGSRADYGLLIHPMRAIQGDSSFQLRLAVTGMHLSPEFGMTVSDIERDRFPVDAIIESLVASDTASSVAKSIGLGTIGFADYFSRRRPDLVILLGDRFEMLAAANAALVANLPIAHLCGGDVTEGAYDESIRHAITKMAHIHFVTNEAARRRVLQLGEDPRNVHMVGSPGLDFIRLFEPTAREILAVDLGLDIRSQWLLVTFHPVTRDEHSSEGQLMELLTALDDFHSRGLAIVITSANADNDGRALNALIERWTASRTHARFYQSLGQQRYLSLMCASSVIVGNSSSGLYEAPSFRKPTVNIGLRQAGRLRAGSVLDCEPECSAIRRQVEHALALDCSSVENPYGDGRTSSRILSTLHSIEDFGSLLTKRFHDVVPAL